MTETTAPPPPYPKARAVASELMLAAERSQLIPEGAWTWKWVAADVPFYVPTPDALAADAAGHADMFHDIRPRVSVRVHVARRGYAARVGWEVYTHTAVLFFADGPEPRGDDAARLRWHVRWARRHAPRRS